MIQVHIQGYNGIAVGDKKPTASTINGFGNESRLHSLLGPTAKDIHFRKPCKKDENTDGKMALTCRDAGRNSKVVFPSIFEVSGFERLSVSCHSMGHQNKKRAVKQHKSITS